MTTFATRIRTGLYAAAVALALAFGARSAIAAPAPEQQDCTDPTAVGTCRSTSDCRKICNRLSNGLIPVCDTRTLCCSCQKL
jgi:hypothetical protein